MVEHSDSSQVNGDAPGGVVREILRMAAAGMSCGAIAAHLNTRRGPGSAGRRWDTAFLREIFSKSR